MKHIINVFMGITLIISCIFTSSIVQARYYGRGHRRGYGRGFGIGAGSFAAGALVGSAASRSRRRRYYDDYRYNDVDGRLRACEKDFKELRKEYREVFDENDDLRKKIRKLQGEAEGAE